MKKLLYLFFIICAGITSSAQTSSTDEVKYKADGIYITFQNNSGKTVNRVPLGKSPNITFNKFFKSFYISWRDENGQLGDMKLFFIMSKDKDSFKMKDTFGNIYTVVNRMGSHGKLLLISEEIINGHSITTIVEGIKNNN